MGERIHDYFEVGTKSVWIIDSIAKTIARYQTSDVFTMFHPGDIADAEPALPGFRVAVDDIFKA